MTSTPRRFSLRGMMVAVALLAIPLWMVVMIRRELDRISPPDAASWARREAAYHAAQPRGPDGFGRPDDTADGVALVRRYAELAEGFERLGAKYVEGTLRGPFTDLLPAGQAVTVQLATRAIASSGDGSGRGQGEGWSVRPGTSCVVVRDGAGDADDCSDDRPIEARLADGDHAGELAQIERVYLRRKP